MSKKRWTRARLTAEGFEGWVPCAECPAALKIDRAAGGVYVVVREDASEPTFLDASPAGRFRGDPSVSREELLDNWVPGAAVLYIGKGDHGVLRTRLSAYVRFGRGGKARHSGGRLIWQVEGAQDFLVAWRVLEADEVPLDVEKAMIEDFTADHGKPPFANRPDMLGR
jgi:hypothetical protein